MDVKTYSKPGNKRLKVFFSTGDENLEPSIYVGNYTLVDEQGFQFYVDDYVADQIDKCEIYLDGLTPKLKLKEGEILEVPEKSEKEKEIERLEYELERLKNAE